MTQFPFVPPYPYWHQTTIAKLPSILKHGLLSPAEAKRYKVVGFRRNFDSSWNVDSVSLISGQSSRETVARYISILVKTQLDSLPAKATNVELDTNRPIAKELLVKGNISPDYFIGIVIGEVGYSFKQEKAIRPIPVSPEKVINIVKESGLKLPIYFKGAQIWPTK